ncbi:ACP S-malonyltransferase [Candidatus Magnetominusculus xianensis]|uniref:Malonyl CoA-acyl carrier protein transacylase n=1 Tax=Candidatus Magnetominusculus xianensis TaxID=1748249 RepID=A0ABR5SCJ8_9BACT|nr:ACP S-malonyltransferase [Candidatus Magnetominusculus xianensis]KWT76836.1 malonyl CoA-ACP transacylase [Candidatus Magnetominusculus xianensis]MBF0402658.1 ACP S-malonyltransferase [Nitrospirota bacterium]
MKRAAFVFPGQGSQSVGMGLDFYEKFDEVRAVYKDASDALGYDISELCFNGPKDELNKTFRTQPCILTTSIAAFTVLKLKGFKPDVVAGHSLGEYSALVAAGVLQLKDAVVLTEKRGHFMQNAVAEGQGLMAAIIGLGRETVDRICMNSTSGYVSPANYNCPEQIVIAGEKPAVEEAIRLAKQEGAKRAVALAVSVPSHCTLMMSASERLGEYMETIPFNKPDIPIVNNADAIVLGTVDKIKSSLVRQLNSPLLWEDSIRTIASMDVEVFVELGPGTVLSGLIKRIVSNVAIYTVNDSTTLERLINA